MADPYKVAQEDNDYLLLEDSDILLTEQETLLRTSGPLPVNFNNS